ncbi:Protein of unknown function [Gryllus bimaculatus]|nr:Protein of unknown function [Gryllus bimaculatus]
MTQKTAFRGSCKKSVMPWYCRSLKTEEMRVKLSSEKIWMYCGKALRHDEGKIVMLFNFGVWQIASQFRLRGRNGGLLIQRTEDAVHKEYA